MLIYPSFPQSFILTHSGMLLCRCRLFVLDEPERALEYFAYLGFRVYTEDASADSVASAVSGEIDAPRLTSLLSLSIVRLIVEYLL